MLEHSIQFNKETQDAIKKDKPIVVLESTIVSHGMPYPENLETAQAVEQIIRNSGVTPATICLHQGKIHIGLENELMEYLAENKDVIKASRRDISYVLSQNLTASTTVAATLFCAHLAQLPIFVTGGIGGVHPEVTEHFDISADLIELSNTPLTVVCSGAKSILDLPKTLEFLETYSVPVIGYQTDEFPAFYSRSSGLKLAHRLNTPEEIANLMQLQKTLSLKNAIIIANPIPESAEIPDEQINPHIQLAHEEAKHLNGKIITPFLLKRLSELSAGLTLKANIELIKNNAQLGAKIALAYKKNK